jgi:hypothetical protein
MSQSATTSAPWTGSISRKAERPRSPRPTKATRTRRSGTLFPLFADISEVKKKINSRQMYYFLTKYQIPEEKKY